MYFHEWATDRNDTRLSIGMLPGDPHEESESDGNESHTVDVDCPTKIDVRCKLLSFLQHGNMFVS